MKLRTPTSEDMRIKQEMDESLDEALEETFPASDPIAPADPTIDERNPA